MSETPKSLVGAEMSLTLERIKEIREAQESRIGDDALIEADATSEEVLELCDMALRAAPDYRAAWESLERQVKEYARTAVFESHERAYQNVLNWMSAEIEAKQKGEATP